MSLESLPAQTACGCTNTSISLPSALLHPSCPSLLRILPGLSLVILSSVRLPSKASFLGKPGPHRAQNTQPTPVWEEPPGQRCQGWVQRHGSTRASGSGRPRPLHTWSSCGLPETVFEAPSLCHPWGVCFHQGFSHRAPRPDTDL